MFMKNCGPIFFFKSLSGFRIRIIIRSQNELGSSLLYFLKESV